MKRRAAIRWSLIAAGFAAGAVSYRWLPTPDLVRGRPWPPARVATALLLPATAAAIDWVLGRLWRSDYVRDPIAGGDEAIDRIRLRVVLFVLALHGLLVADLAGVGALKATSGRLAVLLLALLCIGVGNELPRTRPNLVIGLRTRRTLADRRLWLAIHRTGGRVVVAAGFVLVACALFVGGRMLGPIAGAALLASALAIAHSYRQILRA